MAKKRTKKSSRKIVKVGVAALGRSGLNIHVNGLLALKSKYKIVAVFDKNKAHADKIAADLKCRAYGDYRDLLADDEVELVVNATPSHLHAPFSIEAMKAGKDVLCEKPMALNVKEADAMIRASKRTGRLLAIFQNRRYHPDFAQVKKVIDSGVLGRIVHIRIAFHKFARRWDWQTLKRFGGGELNNTCPHPLDQALTFFGDKKPKVACWRDRTLTLGDADDHNKIVLSAKGCPTVEVEQTAANPYPQPIWTVMGTQGGLTGSATELKWKYFNPKKAPKQTVNKVPMAHQYDKEELPMVEKEWSLKPGADFQEGRKNFYRGLHKTLTEGAPLMVTPESVRRQIWVIEECKKLSPV